MTSSAVAFEVALVGVLFTGVGALAFSGRWRWWARRRRVAVSAFSYPFLPLGVGCMGIGLLIMVLGGFLPSGVGMLLVYVGSGVVLLGGIGMRWVPRALLPRWYLSEKGLDRRVTRAAEETDLTQDGHHAGEPGAPSGDHGWAP